MKLEVFLLPLAVLLCLWMQGVDGGRKLNCNNETVNLCEKHKSWKVSRITGKDIYLSDCSTRDLRRRNRLLLFVSRGSPSNYGKYDVTRVRSVKADGSGCLVKAKRRTSLRVDDNIFLIAQRFPSFKKVTMRNNCVLTCDPQKGGLGGVLAFRANTLDIDSTSKIEMSGKGFRGGIGGDARGGGGYGGETFLYPMEPNMGKGGDASGAPWANNTDGIGGGGGGDGPSSKVGSRGGPGGYNAGGGGGDSNANADDGAGAGGGGGHFSGGGGGGGGNGCSTDGGKGGTAGSLGSFAGGGGQSTCPGGDGGDGGEPGELPPGKAKVCYDFGATGGNAGSALLGGGGGDSCGSHFGSGGGGGGPQFGSTAFKTRLSYGGGGGGGGGATLDPNPGGRGGNGGGLVFLRLKTLKLDGLINANGEPGQCLSQRRQRSAPGGSGAGGSVVIVTKNLSGDPKDTISVSGAGPVKCAFGAGGGGGGGAGRWVVKADDVLHTG